MKQFGYKILGSKTYFFLIFVTVFAVFSNTIRGEFLMYDDYEGIVNDLQVKNLSDSAKTWNIFNIYKALVFKFFGMSSSAYHTFPIILHAINSIIVYLLAKRVIGNKYAFMSSLLFAVHPALVESVSWISGSIYTFFGFFSLLTIYLFVLYKSTLKRKWLVLSVLVYILYIVFLQTPWAMVTPFIIIALDQFYFSKKLDTKKYKLYLLYIVPMLLFFSLTMSGMLKDKNTALEGVRQSTERPNILVLKGEIAARSINLFVFPFNLYIFPNPIFLNNFTYMKIFLSFLFLGILLFILYEKNRKLFALFLCTYIGILPSFAPFDYGVDASERYFYVSVAFFTIFLVLLLMKAQEKVKEQNIIVPIFILLFTLFSLRSFLRTFDWIDDRRLLEATAITSSKNYKVHVNLGVMYHENNDLESSLASYKKALELNPQSYEAIHNIGVIYAETGNYELAKEYILKTFNVTPNNYIALYMLGTIEKSQGNEEKALYYFNKALEINPRHEPTLDEVNKILRQ